MKPVFVSVGHRISLVQAVQLTLACGKGYRIPEPTRQADLLAERAKRGGLEEPMVASCQLISQSLGRHFEP